MWYIWSRFFMTYSHSTANYIQNIWSLSIHVQNITINRLCISNDLNRYLHNTCKTKCRQYYTHNCSSKSWQFGWTWNTRSVCIWWNVIWLCAKYWDNCIMHHLFNDALILINGYTDITNGGLFSNWPRARHMFIQHAYGCTCLTSYVTSIFTANTLTIFKIHVYKGLNIIM